MVKPTTSPLRLAVFLAASAAPVSAQFVPVPTLDTRPAFMQLVTNQTVRTNVVIVTNYVLVTNLTVTTNFYNAQGQLLQPVPGGGPAIPGLIPIPGTQPAAPDPAAVKAVQVQAIRDLLAAGVVAASNKLCRAGSFTNTPENALQIPAGVTVLDAKKGQRLAAALNAAAERAAPEAMPVLHQAVSRLKVDDPARVLQGAPDAATRLLRDGEGENIAAQVAPVVERAAQAAHVPEAYAGVMLRGGGLLGAVLGTTQNVDLNAHITQGLIEATFKAIAAEENRIRTDPTARKTKALQEAFKK